jgi:penicillin-binding protein 2
MNRLRILDELGEELQRAARRELGDGRSRRSVVRRAAAAVPVAVAVAIAALVALVAIVSIGSRAHRPAAAPRIALVRGEIVDRSGQVLVRSIRAGRGYVRSFPMGDLAAQVFGVARPISNAQRRNPRLRDVPRGTIVGESDLELNYDSYLLAGDTLKLALDARLQQVGQQALQEAISGNAGADGGAFVALNPQNGEVYAMGSLPAFDPNILSGRVSSGTIRRLGLKHAFLNRATQFAGPPGSTLTPITALAALESGAWNTYGTYDDTGQFCISGQCRRNAGGAANGVLNVVNAIRVSDGVFFYNLGALTNTPAPAGGALQEWAQAFGVGLPTAIDLSGEVRGVLPTPAWREHVDVLEAACERGRHVSSCGIADGRPWSIGDNINLAVGQGDVQVTPLQLAVAYAALANGGTIVRPHLADEVERPDGTVLERIAAPPVRNLNIDPLYLATIRQGLRAAASQLGGTSADVFGNFPEQVYGQTGTAQYNNQQDYAWYAGFVPASATSKPIVVVVAVQEGGFGDAAAAPVAREILSQWFLGRPGPWTRGGRRTL